MFDGSPVLLQEHRLTSASNHVNFRICVHAFPNKEELDITFNKERSCACSCTSGPTLVMEELKFHYYS